MIGSCMAVFVLLENSNTLSRCTVTNLRYIPMPRRARAAFLYDIRELRDMFQFEDLDDLDEQHVVQAFLERILFESCGFNVVRTVSDFYCRAPYQRYLEWKICPRRVANIFDPSIVPMYLRCEECYVYVRKDTVLIAYF